MSSFDPPDEEPLRHYLRDLIRQTAHEIRDRMFLPPLSKGDSADVPTWIPYPALAYYRSQRPPQIQETGTRFFSSFDEAFEFNGARLLLLGNTGVGKTTTLLRFAHERARICLSYLDTPPPAPGESAPLAPFVPLLGNILHWDLWTPPSEWVWNSLSQKYPGLDLCGLTPVYLFDGLDEIGREELGPPERDDSRAYQLGSEFLQAVGSQFTNAAIVLSCRTEDAKEAQRKTQIAAACRMLPLTPEQVERFLHGREQQELWEMIAGDPVLPERVATPLPLALLSRAVIDAAGLEAPPRLRHLFDLVAPDGDSYSPNAITVFDLFVRMRFAHEAEKGVLLCDEPTTRQRLGRIALESFLPNPCMPASEFTLSQAASQIGEEYLETQEFLAFAETLHLVRPTRFGSFAFIHASLRDYLAVPLLIETLFVGGEHEEDDEDQEVEPMGHTEYQAAAIALARLRDPRTQPAIIAALSSDNPNMRRRAVQVTQYQDKDDALRPILSDLYASEPAARVRQEIVRTLAGSRSSESLSFLIHALDDPDSDVSNTAITVLGYRHDEEGRSALLQPLRQHSNEDVRTQAAAKLRGPGNPTILSALTDALNDSSSRVRFAATGSLWWSGPEAAPALITALTDEEPAVRHTAIQALRFTRAHLPYMTPREPNEFNVAHNLVERFQHPDAVPVLAEKFQFGDMSTRCQAEVALRRISSPAAAAYRKIMANRAETTWDMRLHAACALRELEIPDQMPAVAETLIELLPETDSVYAGAAIAILFSINPLPLRALIAFVVSSQENPSPTVPQTRRLVRTLLGYYAVPVQ